MNRRSGILIIVLALLQFYVPADAGWRDWLDKLKGDDTSKATTPQSTATSLSTGDVVAGLKEALQKSSNYAVSYLGKSGGFLDNARVKIPMPESLRGVEKTLRRIGADRYADEFVVSMNHAAERAVTVAAPIFTKAIKDMSFEDAMKILRGSDDAATRYFRDKTETDLTTRMLPLTHEITEKYGVTSNYKRMVSKVGFASKFLGQEAMDLDRYVTQKTLDGLFLVIADEEKKIRTNPVSRTTDLLKKVFGSISSK